MPISREQALELADKWLLHFEGRIVLRDNIAIRKSAEGWSIVARTTPVILGMQTEIMKFSIDANTGEVGVCITFPVSQILRKIDERGDIDDQEKKQVKAKVTEVETELKKIRIDRSRMMLLRNWFENNASWLKDILEIISKVLSMLP